MLTDRRFRQLNSPARDNIATPLLFSLLVHVVLGLGIWYISRPHIPKTAGAMQASLVTPGMLSEMQANAKRAQEAAAQAAKRGSNPTKPTTSPDIIPIEDMLAQPAESKPAKPQTNNSERIFEPVNTQPKSGEAKPVETKPVETQPDDSWVKKQQEIADKVAKQQKQEERLREQARQRERDALAAKRADEKQKAKEKRDAEKQRLANHKKAEAEKDKKLAERRKEIEAAQKAQRKKQEEARKKAEADRRSKSLADGAKNLDNDIDGEFAAIRGPSKADINAAKRKYATLIKQKVEANWTKNTDKIVTVPVTIRIRRNGAVVSANPKTSDPQLKESIRDAVMESSPLPVPPEDAIFNKLFKKPITINFRTQ